MLSNLSGFGAVQTAGGGALPRNFDAARAGRSPSTPRTRERRRGHGLFDSRKCGTASDSAAPSVKLSEDDSARLAWLAASFTLDTRLGICCIRVRDVPHEASSSSTGQQLLVSFSLLEKAVRSLAPELLPACKRLFKEAGRCKNGVGEEYTMTQKDVLNLRRCLASSLLKEAEWEAQELPTRPQPTFRLDSLSTAQIEKITKRWRENLESLRDHGGKLRKAYACRAQTFTRDLPGGAHLRKILEAVFGGDCCYDATRPRHVGLGFSPTFQLLRSEREVAEDHQRLPAWQWSVEVFEVKSRHHFVPRPPSRTHNGGQQQHPTYVPGGEPEEEPPQEAC